MTIDDIAAVAVAEHLEPLGGLHDGPDTIVLLGPKEPGFWAHFLNSPEYADGTPNPLDRWSKRTISGLASAIGAEPLLPYEGPPYHPFFSWALNSGQAWQSPVGLLVHSKAGLLVSYRGAFRVRGHLDLPAASTSPCETCPDRPCLTACPVQALSSDGYDVATCKANIDVDPLCAAGCQVRLACPISQSYPRDPAQTAFHMAAFHQPKSL